MGGRVFGVKGGGRKHENKSISEMSRKGRKENRRVILHICKEDDAPRRNGSLQDGACSSACLVMH